MPSIKWQVRSDKCDYHSGFLPWTLNFAPASAISPPRGSWWGAWTAASPPSVGNFEPSSRILWGKENRHDESHEEPNGNPPRPKTYGNEDNQNTEYYNCSLKHKPLYWFDKHKDTNYLSYLQLFRRLFTFKATSVAPALPERCSVLIVVRKKSLKSAICGQLWTLNLELGTICNLWKSVASVWL